MAQTLNEKLDELTKIQQEHSYLKVVMDYQDCLNLIQTYKPQLSYERQCQMAADYLMEDYTRRRKNETTHRKRVS